MFDFLRRDKQKPDNIPDKMFDSDRKEQITEEVSKSDLDKGYNAYISAYQEYVDIVNQIDTSLSYKHDVQRLKADHDREDVVNHISYLSRAEDRIQDELAGEYEVSGYLYLLFLAQSKCREMIKLLDLYDDD